MIDVLLYDQNFSTTARKTVKIEDEISAIQIRPNEVSIVSIKKFPNGDTQTKVTLFKQENPMFQEIKLN
jgi:hypothetical protein